MTKDEKDLINEKFKGLTDLINEKFTNVYNALEEINDHVQRTNGRVTRLEESREIFNRYMDTRQVTCPTISLVNNAEKRIEDMHKKYEDLNFLLKYPKLFIGGLTIIVIITLMTFLITFKNDILPIIDEKPKIELLK